MKIPTIISLVVLFLLLAFGVYMQGRKSNQWDRVIKEHQKVADSLQTQIDNIIVNVQRKDSLLLQYMSSLDNTLDALKKEAIKNGLAFSKNVAQQDSIRLKYCQEMTKLGSDFTPSNCK